MTIVDRPYGSLKEEGNDRKKPEFFGGKRTLGTGWETGRNKTRLDRRDDDCSVVGEEAVGPIARSVEGEAGISSGGSREDEAARGWARVVLAREMGWLGGRRYSASGEGAQGKMFWGRVTQRLRGGRRKIGTGGVRRGPLS